MSVALDTDTGVQHVLDRFEKRLLSLDRFEKEQPVLVGVSGGLDSIVLVDLLSHFQVPLQIAHVQYGLRGAASFKDADLVRQLAASIGVCYHELDLTNQQPERGSMQEWARDVRYAWFAQLAKEQSLGQVSVAHHADDQLETILLNLNRGSGLAGLSGMSDVRQLNSGITLFRPLLPFNREDLTAYARSRGLVWREDESNTNPQYARNALRQELGSMPLLEYRAFRDAGLGLQSRIAELKKTLLNALHETRHLSEGEWKALPPIIRGWMVLEIIREIDPEAPRRKTVVETVERLLSSQTGRHVEVGSVRVTRERDGLTFSPLFKDAWAEVGFNPLVLGSEIVVGGGSLRVEAILVEPSELNQAHQNEAYLDGDALGNWVVMRRWRDGDRFCPLGSEGSTKVKSFLTDAHVSAAHKKEVPVVDAAGKLAWIVGHRIDERFKVTEKTTNIVHLVWNKTKLFG